MQKLGLHPQHQKQINETKQTSFKLSGPILSSKDTALFLGNNIEEITMKALCLELWMINMTEEDFNCVHLNKPAPGLNFNS